MRDLEQTDRIEKLIEYCRGLKSNMDGGQLYEEYEEYIAAVTPQEAFEVFHGLLEEGIEADEILQFLGKVINVFYKSLLNHRWEKPKDDRFLMDLIAENEGLLEKTDGIRKILLEGYSLETKKAKLLPRIEELQEFDDHYVKKENILFPYMENMAPKFHGLSIMWELHDVVRNRLREGIDIMKDSDSTEAEVNRILGGIFFGMLGLKNKEELILFPAASEVLEDRVWGQMYRQSLEYDFPFIERPEAEVDMYDELEILEEGRFRTETGELNFEEILMIFNALPVEFTFVDEDNKVRYFTKPKDRLFPRSPAVIGRDVNNCHPPASVHIVEEIVESFRNGKEDSAQFWIDMKGRKIFIQYFALRDNDGAYRGVLEVSQDITEIQQLKGERRLLKWGEDRGEDR